MSHQALPAGNFKTHNTNWKPHYAKPLSAEAS
jgi:hypothetical protein